MKKNLDLIFLLALILILFLSFFLNIFLIDQEGFGNHYYAAAVKSMMLNFKNFFFASSDANGFISVDKPPLGLWIQSIFALIFGFNGFIVMLPSILAGTLSVFLLYIIVKKSFGNIAALVAALVLAITPVFVALSRNNTMDSILICVVLCSAWQFLKGLERNRLRNIIYAVVILGLGFNIKMAQALIILPSIVLCYFIFFKATPLKKTSHSIISAVILLVVSFSWAFVVEITPEEDRPYVGGTAKNSVFELALGYNGISRAIASVETGEMRQPHNFIFETGKPGILRLFNEKLGGQVSWFVPIAILGALAYWIYGIFIASLTSAQKQQLLFWGSLFVFLYIYLNLNNGLFHTHYIALIAPASAALSGIGVIGLYKCYNSKKMIQWILPTTVIVSMGVQILLSGYFPEWNTYLTIIMVIISILSILILLINILLKYRLKNKVIISTLIITFLSFLIIPFAWALTPILYGGDPGIPYARPDLKDFKESASEYLGIFDYKPEEYSKLIDFLESNRDGEEYLLGIDASLPSGSHLILFTDGTVMCTGGFGGNVPAISAEKFREFVQKRKIRYYLAGPNSSVFETPRWIKSYGKIVLYKEWKNPKDLQGYTLYDCRPE